MTPLLLPLLCDPVTREPLTLSSAEYDRDGNIISGVLTGSGRREYPIRHGIPRFVADAELKKTVESFGDEWNHFNYTDFKRHWLAHTVTNTFGDTSAFNDKVIVDAGGGSGAQTVWMLENGAKHVILLELSHAVDGVVADNLKRARFTNVDVIQCSIDAPPLRPRSIDGMVICHNVIQHTPSVEKTAAALFGLVADGGEFVFNCYPKNDLGVLRWLRFHLVYSGLRAVLPRLPFSARLVYAQVMGLLRLVPVMGTVLEKSGFCGQGDVPRSSDSSALGHLRARYRATVLNTFDCFGSHAFQHHKTDDELRKLLASLQGDSSKIRNVEKYFSRPQPMGCALRVFR